MGNNITVGTGNIDHTSTTTAITGVGFKPTAIIFLARNSSGTFEGYSGSGASHEGWSAGFAANDGTMGVKCGIWTSQVDNHASNRRASASYCLWRVYADIYGGYGGEVSVWGAVDGASTIQSWDADGFTLYHNVDYAADFQFYYMAIRAPHASVIAVSPSATGNQSYTGVGFQPDALISINSLSPDDNTKRSVCAFGMGVSDGTNDLTMALRDWDSSGTAYSSRYLINTEFISDYLDNRGSVVTLDEDGFTLNWAEAGATTSVSSVLCLGGVNAYVGSTVSQTDTVDEPVTGVGFQPDGLIFIGYDGSAWSTANTWTTGQMNSVGLVSGPTERRMVAFQTNNGATVAQDTDLDVRSDAFWSRFGNEVYHARADLVSLDEDGFTFKMDDADTINSRIGFLALQVIDTDYRDRLVKYLHNTHQSGKLGRASFRDIVGREVPPHQLEVDNWAFSGGALWPTPVKYENMLEDPNAFYFESLKPKDTEVQVETDRESYFESIMRKLGAR